MNRAEFQKPIQPEVTLKTYDVSKAAKNDDRQSRIADLKARVQAGTYQVDNQSLVNQLLRSGALDND